MWYFAWALGVGFAVVFGVANALWTEISPGRCGE
jgi:cyd operon protein YbgT